MPYQSKVFKEWKGIIKGEQLARNCAVRPEILESWKRCTALHKGAKLPPQEVTIKKAHVQHEELCRSALPIMDKYSECFAQEHGLLMLISPEGVLLHCLGDLALMRHDDIHVGSDFSEEHIGTNAVGLCLKKQGHAEVVGAEHFKENLHKFGCCAEPLWGGKFRFLGALGIVLPLGNYHNWVGMLLRAIASDINHQHHVHDLLSDQATMLELLNDGIVILNKVGDIKAINNNARRMLGIHSDDKYAIGHISAFVHGGAPFLNILKKKLHITDEENSLQIGKEVKRYIISTSSIPEDKGVVFTLAGVERMRKFAVRTAGFRAMYKFSDILGSSDIIRSTIQLAEMAAQSDITTLLLGESGTGKELFAHAAHNGSARRDAPFVAVNCGALPRELVHSELFGYEAGAFTGAMKGGKPGKFELADGGTIFLDEIGEMPMEAQTSLLRIIQSKEVNRVGGTSMKPLNVRIIAATNRNLAEAIEHGTFRSDLYYRLSVLVINIPSLRSRPSDIPELAVYFLHKYTSSLNRPPRKFMPDVLRVLQEYSWPGNIRELENVIEYVVATSQNSNIMESDLPQSIKGRQKKEDFAEKEEKMTRSLHQKERQAIIDSLTLCNGNISASAHELGIARSALYSKLARFGIDHAKFRLRYR